VAACVNAAISGTGWEIGENEISDRRRTLEFTGTDTAVKRLYEIAAAFDAEITFSYDIDGLSITGRYVDIRQRIGKDVDAYLRTGREIQRIIVKRSAAELATAVWPQCDDVSLPGYDDGDMYTQGGILYSRDALSRWARADGGHIVKTYDSEAKTAQSLLDGAKRSLSIARELETTYEVDLASLPEGVGIGDRIHLVDESDRIYLSARILELETSETSGTRKATLGEIEEE
jgi:phage minor structural protein